MSLVPTEFDANVNVAGDAEKPVQVKLSIGKNIVLLGVFFTVGLVLFGKVKGK